VSGSKHKSKHAVVIVHTQCIQTFSLVKYSHDIQS